MRFLIDANLPRSVCAVAERAGDEALHVSDLGLGSATDAAIAEHAKTNGMVLVTRDLDFADVRAYPPQAFPGFLVLRLPEHCVAAKLCDVFGLLLAQREMSTASPGASPSLRRGEFEFGPRWTSDHLRAT